MRPDDLLDAFGALRPETVGEALSCRKRAPGWLKWGSAAAILCCVTAILLVSLIRLHGERGAALRESGENLLCYGPVGFQSSAEDYALLEITPEGKLALRTEEPGSTVYEGVLYTLEYPSTVYDHTTEGEYEIKADGAVIYRGKVTYDGQFGLDVDFPVKMAGMLCGVDGRLYYYYHERDTGNTALCSVRTDGTDFRRYDGAPFDPMAMAAGEGVLYCTVEGGYPAVFDPETGETKILSETAPANVGGGVWSDGGKLWWLSHGGGGYALYRADPETGEAERLSQFDGTQVQCVGGGRVYWAEDDEIYLWDYQADTVTKWDVGLHFYYVRAAAEWGAVLFSADDNTFTWLLLDPDTGETEVLLLGTEPAQTPEAAVTPAPGPETGITGYYVLDSMTVDGAAAEIDEGRYAVIVEDGRGYLCSENGIIEVTIQDGMLMQAHGYGEAYTLSHGVLTILETLGNGDEVQAVFTRAGPPQDAPLWQDAVTAVGAVEGQYGLWRFSKTGARMLLTEGTCATEADGAVYELETVVHQGGTSGAWTVKRDGTALFLRTIQETALGSEFPFTLDWQIAAAEGEIFLLWRVQSGGEIVCHPAVIDETGENFRVLYDVEANPAVPVRTDGRRFYFGMTEGTRTCPAVLDPAAGTAERLSDIAISRSYMFYVDGGWLYWGGDEDSLPAEARMFRMDLQTGETEEVTALAGCRVSWVGQGTAWYCKEADTAEFWSMELETGEETRWDLRGQVTSVRASAPWGAAAMTTIDASSCWVLLDRETGTVLRLQDAE